LHFKVEKYSLCKDVKRAMKHPVGGGKEFLTPPLLVMNNFVTPESKDGAKSVVPKHLESLTTTVFQSLFPPISPQTTPLSSIRRVLLLNREPADPDNDDGVYTINLRHYAITTKPTGLSRGIRRLNAAEKLMNSTRKAGQAGKRGKGAVPNLSNLDDVADYLLDPSAAAAGYTSESEVETDAEVEVLQGITKHVLNPTQRKKLEQKRAAAGEKGVKGSRNNVEKRAVKLVELGPRLKLRLSKVEEGVCGGKVMWHEYIHKSVDEVKALDKKWAVKNAERERRKKEQKDNVERKKKEKGQGAQEEDEDEPEEWDSDEMESGDEDGDVDMDRNEDEDESDEENEDEAEGG
jgi:ribosome biogenesis protein SSF1/2